MNKLRTILLQNKLYIILVILVIIYSFIFTTLIKHKSIYTGKEKTFECIVKEYKIDGNKLSLTLKSKEKLIGTYYITSEEEKEYLTNNIKIGSTLLINGELNTPSSNTVPYLFNYKEYLYNNKIYYTLNINNINIINKELNIFYKIKNYMYERALKYDINGYMYAFILGKTFKINEDVLNSFRTNGVSHLFALSGLHVSIFSLILMKILKKIKVNLLNSYILVFIFLLLFSFITGFSPSILRASLLFFFLGLNKVFNLNIETKNILYIVLIILLLINPFLIYNLSFILSFTTTYFLIILSIDNNDNYIKGLLKTSFISFISNIILSIYYFGYINPIGILMNLIFVPLVTYIIFPLTIISFILPIFSYILNLLINIMEFLSLKLSLLSLKIYFKQISIIYVFIYYLLLLIYARIRNKHIFIPMILLVFYLYIIPYIDNNLYIYYIDVGQGDSSLLILPNMKKTVLIDTGGKIKYKVDDWKIRSNEYSIGEDTIIPFMRKLGIKKLDYLVLTHGDTDHMGESNNIVDNFKVKNVIFNCGSYNQSENYLISNLNKKNINYNKCINKININDLKLDFLNNKEYDNENDNSSVIYFNYNNYKFLFMGDAGVNREKDILDKYNLNNIEFLKVGHHGSDTSSSSYFINNINPKYSIISVGKNNRYNHPKDSVLKILNKSKIYRTDIDGSIEIKLNKKGYKISTYPSY